MCDGFFVFRVVQDAAGSTRRKFTFHGIVSHLRLIQETQCLTTSCLNNVYNCPLTHAYNGNLKTKIIRLLKLLRWRLSLR